MSHKHTPSVLLCILLNLLEILLAVFPFYAIDAWLWAWSTTCLRPQAFEPYVQLCVQPRVCNNVAHIVSPVVAIAAGMLFVSSKHKHVSVVHHNEKVAIKAFAVDPVVGCVR